MRVLTVIVPTAATLVLTAAHKYLAASGGNELVSLYYLHYFSTESREDESDGLAVDEQNAPHPDNSTAEILRKVAVHSLPFIIHRLERISIIHLAAERVKYITPCYNLAEPFNAKEKLLVFPLMYMTCTLLSDFGSKSKATANKMLEGTVLVPQTLQDYLVTSRACGHEIDDWTEGFIEWVNQEIPQSTDSRPTFKSRLKQLSMRMILAASVNELIIDKTRAMKAGYSQDATTFIGILKGALRLGTPALVYMQSFTSATDYVTDTELDLTDIMTATLSIAIYNQFGDCSAARTVLNSAISAVKGALPNIGLCRYVLPAGTADTLHQGESKQARAAYLALNILSEGTKHAVTQIAGLEKLCPPLMTDWIATLEVCFPDEELQTHTKIALAFALGHAVNQVGWSSKKSSGRLREFREATIAKDLLKSCYAKFIADARSDGNDNEPVTWGLSDSYVVEKLFDFVLTLAMCYLIRKIKSAIQDHLSDEAQIIGEWALYAYLTTCDTLLELRDTVLELRDHNIQQLLSGPQALADIITSCAEMIGIYTAVAACAKDELEALKKDTSNTAPNAQPAEAPTQEISEDTTTPTDPPPSSQEENSRHSPSVTNVSMFSASIHNKTPTLQATASSVQSGTLNGNLPDWLTSSIGFFPRYDFGSEGIAMAEDRFKMHTLRKELLEIQAWVGDGKYENSNAQDDFDKEFKKKGWKLLDSTDYGEFSHGAEGEKFRKMNVKGYRGIAVQYENTSRKPLLVIVTRGTHVPPHRTTCSHPLVLQVPECDKRNLPADIDLVLRQRPSNRYCKAGQFFVDYVVAKYHPQKKHPEIFVGHSLGCSFNMWMDAVTHRSSYILNIDAFGSSIEKLRKNCWKEIYNTKPWKIKKDNVESIIARRSLLRATQHHHVGEPYKLRASHASRDISNKYNKEWESAKMDITTLRKSLSEESKERRRRVNEKTTKRRSENRAKKMERRGDQQTSAASCPAMP